MKKVLLPQGQNLDFLQEPTHDMGHNNQLGSKNQKQIQINEKVLF